MKSQRVGLTSLVAVMVLTGFTFGVTYNFEFGTFDSGSSASSLAGWTRIDSKYHDFTGVGYGDHGAAYDLGGGVLAGWEDSYNVGAGVGEAYGWAGTPLANIMSDCAQLGSGRSSGFTLKGIADGTYDVTFYTWIVGYPNQITNWVLDYGTGSTTMTTGPDGYSYNYANVSRTARITLNSGSNNGITLYPSSSSNDGGGVYWIPLNGLTVAQVPEPATLSLLSIGLVALKRIRRL